MGTYTLYEALKLANNFLTPNDNTFFEYAINTSDDNMGFFRTCYKKKTESLPDGELGKDITTIVVCGEGEINKESLTYKSWSSQPKILLTNLKMQICFTDADSVKEEIDWNDELGYRYCYVFDLRNKKEVTSSYV